MIINVIDAPAYLSHRAKTVQAAVTALLDEMDIKETCNIAAVIDPWGKEVSTPSIRVAIHTAKNELGIGIKSRVTPSGLTVLRTA